jgi:4a-hydroxytetrahydrobiopterin dehydratase
MGRDRLSETEIQTHLSALNDLVSGEAWALVDGKLSKEFVFEDFVQAFGFMTKAAIHAQVLDHHPEWSNVYKKVRVALTTHSAGGLTALDFALAERMESVSD